MSDTAHIYEDDDPTKTLCGAPATSTRDGAPGRKVFLCRRCAELVRKAT